MESSPETTPTENHGVFTPLCDMKRKINVMNPNSTISPNSLGILTEPSEAAKKERGSILADLRKQPASGRLERFFSLLAQRSYKEDENTFVDGLTRFADAIKSDQSLCGLHYPASWIDHWDSQYPELATTIWDQDFHRQCPPSWSHSIQPSAWVLAYEGDNPLTLALNELVKGPSTLDCGIFCQLIIWMALRWMLGDEQFNRTFKFDQRKFFLSHEWDRPTDGHTVGNLLFPFYDDVRETTLYAETRIRTRTVWNHASYLEKHPGGMARLQNVTQVDGRFYIFDPETLIRILSEEELDQYNRKSYNAPRNHADFLKLELWRTFPNYTHPDFAPKSFGDKVKDAELYEHYTLDEQRWEKSKAARSLKGRCGVFNFSRLVSCLQDYQEGGDILAMAWAQISDKVHPCVERREL